MGPSEKGAALWEHAPPRTCCICRSACSSEASGTTSTPRSAMSASHPVGLGRASSMACACSQSVHGASKGQTGHAANSSLSSATCALQCCKSIAPRVSCPACWASGPGHLTAASQECSIPQCMQLCWTLPQIALQTSPQSRQPAHRPASNLPISQSTHLRDGRLALLKRGWVQIERGMGVGGGGGEADAGGLTRQLHQPVRRCVRQLRSGCESRGEGM